jgi:hypothetical protein
MYVKTSGMGMFDTPDATPATGALNCPGDPGCNVASNWISAPTGSVKSQVDTLMDWYNSQTTPTIDPTHGIAPAASAGISGSTIAMAGAGIFGLVLLLKVLR